LFSGYLIKICDFFPNYHNFQTYLIIENNPKITEGLVRLQEHLEALADQLEIALVTASSKR
jgi:hypothetical protein